MKSNKSRFKYRGYVPYTVDKAVKTAVDKEMKKEVDFEAIVMALVGQGYKVTVEWDEANESHCWSMFTSDKGNENNGLILSTRHIDSQKSLVLLSTLHNEVMNGNWPSPEERANQYDW